MRRLFIFSISIGVLLVIVLVTRLSSPAHDARPAAPDASHWQTYRNDTYHFELKYPPELVGFERMYSNNAVGGINFTLPGATPSSFEAYTFNGRRYLDLGRPDPCDPPHAPKHSQVLVGGVTFTRGESPSKSIIYIGRYTDICYRFKYSARPTINDTDAQRFEDIVSTFTILR